MNIDTSLSNKNIDKDFSYMIIKRAKEYYNNGNVIKCFKDENDKYYAKVKGSSSNLYDVIVKYDKNKDDYTYECSCPCGYPCKHIYAVLITIKNKEYSNIVLKEEIEEEKFNLEEVIKNIPAEQIKEYLLSSEGMDKVCFEMTSFSSYFRKYLPKQKYEYYYNNLYNSIILYNNETKLYEYIDNMNEYIISKEYDTAFVILSSIINVLCDLDKLNEDYFIHLVPLLGMNLRIIYRNIDSITSNIDKWIGNIKNKNYYNNPYLEDIILNIK